MSFNNVSVNEK